MKTKNPFQDIQGGEILLMILGEEPSGGPRGSRSGIAGSESPGLFDA
jgi:hypothetical protein